MRTVCCEPHICICSKQTERNWPVQYRLHRKLGEKNLWSLLALV